MCVLPCICPFLPRGPKMRRGRIFCGPFVATEMSTLAERSGGEIFDHWELDSLRFPRDCIVSFQPLEHLSVASWLLKPTVIERLAGRWPSVAVISETSADEALAGAGDLTSMGKGGKDQTQVRVNLLLAFEHNRVKTWELFISQEQLQREHSCRPNIHGEVVALARAVAFTGSSQICKSRGSRETNGGL